jgi:hypothetical protein
MMARAGINSEKLGNDGGGADLQGDLNGSVRRPLGLRLSCLLEGRRGSRSLAPDRIISPHGGSQTIQCLTGLGASPLLIMGEQIP